MEEESEAMAMATAIRELMLDIHVVVCILMVVLLID
jgi:hypothetical protein